MSVVIKPNPCTYAICTAMNISYEKLVDEYIKKMSIGCNTSREIFINIYKDNGEYEPNEFEEDYKDANFSDYISNLIDIAISEKISNMC